MNDICFVFVSLQRINTDRESTSTCIARQLAKNHKVLYINPAIDRRTLLSGGGDQYTKEHIRAIRRNESGLVNLSENLWMYNPRSLMESINWIPSTRVFCYLNRINNYRLAGEIRKAVAEVGIEKFILVNDKDIFRSFYLKELLQPEQYVYLYRDYTLAFDYWYRHGKTLEPALITKSDVVVCNSFGFTDLTRAYNANSHFIGNGCNTDLFDGHKDWSEPADMQKIPHPIIGYCGALTEKRLDIDLLIRMAKSRQDYSLVLVGTESVAFKESELHKLPNVYFLGQKETRELPGYIAHFDVCINPQVVNSLTNDNYPMKIDEYLAMGKAVVATSTKTMQELFSTHTYLAETAEEYLLQIDKALMEDSPALQKERIAFATTHRWENVTERFVKALESTSRLSVKSEDSDSTELKSRYRFA